MTTDPREIAEREARAAQIIATGCEQACLPVRKPSVTQFARTFLMSGFGQPAFWAAFDYWRGERIAGGDTTAREPWPGYHRRFPKPHAQAVA